MADEAPSPHSGDRPPETSDHATQPEPLHSRRGEHASTAADEHAHGDPREHLAHHFDTPEQQFETGKIGIWIFLLTEILFFSALFCAYAVYRSYHPEIFEQGHLHLDTTLGAVNTCVLLFSSLTMAWAVRAAQLSQQRVLVACLALTILCALGFLGIKYVEYSHKFHEGYGPGVWFKPRVEAEHAPAAALREAEEIEEAAAELPPTGPAVAYNAEAATREEVAALDTSAGVPPSVPPEGVHVDTVGPVEHNRRLRIFFSIYFCMTGLHAIHVIAGIGVLAWILVHAVQGRYSAYYFGPVDYVGLYWHLVDLVWIYLFPLLYLIH